MATRDAPAAAWSAAAGAIDPPTARTWLGQMLLIRRFEEKAAELYSAGKIRGFLHLSIGEEAVSVAAIGALTAADNIVSTYREHGHALARGVPPGAIMAELFGKANGASRGRGGSMHIFDVGRRFYGGNAIVGGGLPLAVGLALADRLQQRDPPSRPACSAMARWRRESSTSRSTSPRCGGSRCCSSARTTTTRWARPWRGTRRRPTSAARGGVPDPVGRGGWHGCGCHGRRRRGRRLERVRSGGGPFLLECRTYRFRAHSMYDPELYRSKDEVEQWKRRDPIASLPRPARAGGYPDGRGDGGARPGGPRPPRTGRWHSRRRGSGNRWRTCSRTSTPGSGHAHDLSGSDAHRAAGGADRRTRGCS